tara:strand:- start:1017 stop:1250 length:234 start_codon:yes stop_codon:yes gene_type:complete
MQQIQVGLFKNAEDFAANLVQTFVFYSAITELIDWMSDVEAGLDDPTLPDEVKAQAMLDYNQIQKHVSQFTGSMSQS